MLVDDHAVLRDGLKNILDMEKDIQVVAEAVNGNDAITKVEESVPDVILMDKSPRKKRNSSYTCDQTALSVNKNIDFNDARP
jgi:DNA-binding NarL/FixJ family response regulator